MLLLLLVAVAAPATDEVGTPLLFFHSLLLAEFDELERELAPLFFGGQIHENLPQDLQGCWLVVAIVPDGVWLFLAAELLVLLVFRNKIATCSDATNTRIST